MQGLLGLRVDDWQRPKVLAADGTRLGLIPHPSREPRHQLLVVEGPSDMLAARSAGLAAIAVPGTHAWRAEWASTLAQRDVTVVMDCDRPGRDAAARIARDLETSGARPRIAELAAEREDGYDLSDWLAAGNRPAMLAPSTPARPGLHEQSGQLNSRWAIPARALDHHQHGRRPQADGPQLAAAKLAWPPPERGVAR